MGTTTWLKGTKHFADVIEDFFEENGNFFHIHIQILLMAK